MIAREGILFIGIGAVLTIAFIFASLRYDSKFLFGSSIVLAILTIFVAFFFRDPDRTISAAANELVAPADGKIVQILELDNHPFIGGPAIQVSIFLNVFDVHINRVPSGGTIDYVKYNPGKFLVASEDKASEVNEQTEIGMTTSDGTRLVFKQIAGLIARRIVCTLNESDNVEKGERCGMIKFGSRTDLIVPRGTEIAVKLGQRVKGGETIMARLKDSE